MDSPSRQMSPSARLDYLIELGDGHCAWCDLDLSHARARPTRDHIVPKVKGGPTRLENEVAACGACNRLRGHASPSTFINDSRTIRGVTPNASLIADQLERLHETIRIEGGMRRIRDYVAREARRVRELAST